MPTILPELRAATRVEAHHPWPRFVVDVASWRVAGGELAAGRWTLLGLWGEADSVHMAVLRGDRDAIAVLTLPCADRRFPAIGARHAPAIRLERAAQDLFGFAAEGLPDARPWLDHGAWPVRAPLGRAEPVADAAVPYPFLPAEGGALHQIAVGPVHAGIIEPGHFRFHADGETVVRLEERLGYTHKGTEALMQGADLARAARLAGRISGDSTVASALAFAHAVEAALGLAPPPRAVWLRALAAELERLANHLGDVGAVCNDASFAIINAHCAVLRERVLRAAAVAFGHRLMMDRVVPGGVAANLDATGAAAITALVAAVRQRFPRLVELYDSTASLQDRVVGTGRLDPALARQFGCGGFVGRASGRDFDARRWPGYPPYDDLRFDVPVRTEGDVNARVWIRIEEIGASLGLIEQLLAGLPAGDVRAKVGSSAEAEGAALVEGFRGDILAWVRVAADGTVARCHVRDPSWFQWPVLEAAVDGNIVADFPLCNKSFNCAYSGHDL